MNLQREVNFIIDEQGSCTYLVTEAAASIDLGAVVSRASHVEPDNVVLRVIFHALRRWLGDKGRMSDFTRNWPCLWRVNMAPVGGPVLVERFRDRIAAINAEVQALNLLFIGESK